MDTIQSEIEQMSCLLEPVGPLEPGWRVNRGQGTPSVPSGHRLDVKFRRGNVVRGANSITGEFRWSLIGADGDIVAFCFTPIAAPEVDPHGKDPHDPGAKLDAGKIRPGLVLGGFARALKEVARVGTYGAQKYTENGWVLVPNGVDRYDDAMLRHWLDEHCGVELDKDTELRHAAHAAWNALARLDLLVRQAEGGAA
jgi:hypothetical protein